MLVTIWKWLFTGEKALWGAVPDAGGEGRDYSADRLDEWRCDQREYTMFGYPHYWG